MSGERLKELREDQRRRPSYRGCPTTVRFRLRPTAPSAHDFCACVLFDDGRILFEPRDSRLAGVMVQGLVPPLRPTVLAVELRRRVVRVVVSACAILFVLSLALIALAEWLGPLRAVVAP